MESISFWLLLLLRNWPRTMYEMASNTDELCFSLPSIDLDERLVCYLTMYQTSTDFVAMFWNGKKNEKILKYTRQKFRINIIAKI